MRLACLAIALWGAAALAHEPAHHNDVRRGHGHRRLHVHPGLATTTARHDLSDPLRDVTPLPPALNRAEPIEFEDHPVVRSGPLVPTLLADPVVQTAPGPAPPPATASSFDGLPNVDIVLPPDPNGAVGPNHYVQWVNTSFAIWDKQGNLLYGPAAGNTLWSGFGGPCESSNDGDPIVLHDHLADRWFMSQLALPAFPFGPFYQCIAVSQTADPTGAWYRYAFVVSDTKLNDYPKFGVWPGAYLLAVNQFDVFTGAFEGQGIVAFEREQMLAGAEARMIYLDLASIDPNLGGMLPADLDGPPPPAGAPGYFVQFDDDGQGVVSQDQLQLWRFAVDWANPTASDFTGPFLLPTAPFDASLCNFAETCVPQPGTPQRVAALSDRLMFRLQYRNFLDHEALVVNHTVNVGGDHAGIRWYEIRDPGGRPAIFQQGTYAPDADHRWMGSAAMDAAGDLAIGFSVSGAATYPSVRFAGRLASDPPGVLAQGETALVDGGGVQLDDSGRWGDYSALTVDPTDHCTFWYTQEYYAATSLFDWSTRIGSFRFPSCAVTLPFVRVETSASAIPESGTAAATITVSRRGATDGDLLVPLTISGAARAGVDYVALPDHVTIPAGADRVALTVTALDDAAVEPDETVVVTAAADPAYTVGTPFSAVVAIVNDDLPPDLTVSALTVPGSSGAGSAIVVTDTTRNQGAGPAALPSTTRFFLSSNATLDAQDRALGARSVPALAAGAADTASTTLVIPANTLPGTWSIIAQADADHALTESQEGNNTVARLIVVGADLTVGGFTVPTNTGAGETITVSDTTRNQGGGPAPATTTGFYLSANSAWDAGDVRLGTRTVPALAGGTASTGSTTITIPSAIATGAWFLVARADDGGVIAETSENNNTAVRAIQIGPDLVPGSLTVPAAAAAGAVIAVTETTRNGGGGAAAASTTAFYVSSDTVLDLRDDTLLGSRAVAALAAGGASTATTTLTLPPGLGTGTWFVLVRADDGNVVPETQEGNNVVAGSVRIGPDLVIAALTVPATAGRGTSIPVSDTTRNQGGSDAPATSTAFFLSTDATLSADDRFLGARDVPALAAGTSDIAASILVIPADVATGAWFVLVRADDGNRVAETTETNNTTARSLQIGPDLAVSALTVPAAAGEGTALTVTDTTRNQGGGDAEASATAFYLSTNTTFDAGDLALGTRAVPALPAGASHTATTTLTVPAGTSTGTWFLIARADVDAQVGETIETNNTAARSFVVGPDLGVSGLTAPTSAAIGSTVTVSDTTRNQGGGTASASTTAFYLSSNAIWESSDVRLGARAIPALAGGAVSTGTVLLTLPGDTAPGTWFLLARADDQNVVVETQESNNVASRSILVGPDLVLSTLTVPASATIGTPFAVSDTTRNQGTDPAVPSNTGFYLSTNSTLDAADIPIGGRAVPALAAGASSAGSAALVAPAAIAPGVYFVIAKADADGTVAESQEGNNTTARSIRLNP